MKTLTPREIREIEMFGMLKEELRKQTEGIEPLPMALSMLSDAQEEIARGNPEQARQIINRAKLFILDKIPPRQK